MGRKAKDAAQQKIGEWTGRRNMSKTTTNKENANASNENRTPLQTQSQSDLNAMKNCTVRLEKLQEKSKKIVAVNKTPVKNVPIADVITKDKQAIYDYSFDADDTPGPMKETEDEMKDLFKKLAKDNIIEVKKYRPKNVKKGKTDGKNPVEKAVTQKRRREKQLIDVEPPQKKRDLKRKVANVNVPTKPSVTFAAEPTKGNSDAERRQVKPILKQIEHVNAQPRLRNRNFQNLQSTPKTSTPLGTKSNAMNKKNASLNSMFFDNESPLIGRSTRSNIQKQRLQLSAINDSQEDVPNENVDQNKDNKNVPQFHYNDDDDDFDFGNNDANEPEPDFDVDKENSFDRPSTSAQNRPSTSSAASHLWDQPSTSAAALRSLDKPGKSLSADKNRPATSSGILRSLDRPSTSSSASNSLDQPSTSAAALRSSNKPEKSVSVDKNRLGTSSGILRSLDRPNTSSNSSNAIAQGARTPLRNNNDNSVFELSSDYNIFSPTKRRVYGRSPLKNITSEVNNTSSPSFESVKSAPRSFGMLPKLSLNSIQTTVNSTKGVDVTLPEASYFSSRRAAQVFDRNVDNQCFADDCFGFGDCDDDEEIINETINKKSETTENTITITKSEAEKSALKDIRAKLKRFLHNPDAEKDESIKMSKVTNNKNKSKKVKNPAKVVKSPAKPKRNIVFVDAGAIQKDIRSAFTVKPSDTRKKDNSKDDPVNLFEEVNTVQDRRRSYSRPQRQRKRRISIESESEEEQHSEDEDYDENGKKRTKRRKKTTEPNPNELEELEEFARQTNQHFDEIDSFELVVE